MKYSPSHLISQQWLLAKKVRINVSRGFHFKTKYIHVLIDKALYGHQCFMQVREPRENLKKKKVIFYTCTSCVSLGNILAVVLCSIQVVKRTGIQNYENTILWISAVSISSKLNNKIKQLTRFIKTNFQYFVSEPYNYSVYSWILLKQPMNLIK